MKLGWPISFFLHALLIFGGLIAFSSGVKPIAPTQFIPVDIVSIGDVTNIKAAKKAKPEDVIVEPETPMRSKAVPIEGVKTPKEDDKSDATKDTKPVDPKTSNQTGETSKPQRPTKDDPPEPPKFDLGKMAELIDQSRTGQTGENAERALFGEAGPTEFAKTAREGAGQQSELSVSEVDALRSRMYSCWRVSVDAKDSETLSIRVRVQLFPDGSVKKVDLLDQAKIAASSSSYLQIAAERALRAVSKCAPYDFLPQEKYGTWKDMELTFQPEA